MNFLSGLRGFSTQNLLNPEKETTNRNSISSLLNPEKEITNLNSISNLLNPEKETNKSRFSISNLLNLEESKITELSNSAFKEDSISDKALEEPAKKRQKIGFVDLTNVEHFNSFQPFYPSYPNLVGLDSPQCHHQQKDNALLDETNHISNQKPNKKERTDLLEGLLEKFVLTPEAGWRKGSPEDLKAALIPRITKSMRDKILPSMTLFVSPKNNVYIFVVKRVRHAPVVHLSEKNNASLMSEYELIDWKIRTPQTKEIEWINKSLTDFCMPSVLEWYDEEYPYSRGSQKNMKMAAVSVAGTFACYVRKNDEN